MYSSELLISEAVPICNDLRALVADADPNTKDDLLYIATGDPTYKDAIDANALIFGLRRQLGSRILQLGGTGSDFRPELETPDQDTDASFIITSGDLIIEFGANYPFSRLNPAQHEHVLRKILLRLVHDAHTAAQELADSWRMKNFGCRGFYLDEINNRYGVFSSGNIKLHDLAPKVCAERINLEKARSHEFTRLVALVVAGEPLTENTNEKKTATPHPCGVCRLDLVTNPLVSNDESLIICASRDKRQEEFTVNELWAFHGDSVS